MAKKRKDRVPERQASVKVRTDARSLRLAKGQIKTGQEFANLMTALMSDLIEEKVTPRIGNAVCNAGGKLLKVVELQYKHGKQMPGGDRTLYLTGDKKDV
jgi:hypothetical protein